MTISSSLPGLQLPVTARENVTPGVNVNVNGVHAFPGVAVLPPGLAWGVGNTQIDIVGPLVPRRIQFTFSAIVFNNSGGARKNPGFGLLKNAGAVVLGSNFDQYIRIAGAHNVVGPDMTGTDEAPVIGDFYQIATAQASGVAGTAIFTSGNWLIEAWY